MMRLAVSFGQGLQMTNILKDIWEDRQTETCWLPRSVFINREFGFELERLEAQRDGEAFSERPAGADRHRTRSPSRSVRLPAHDSDPELGIRRFCFWALGLALLTLRKHSRPTRRSHRAIRSRSHARTIRAAIMAKPAADGHQPGPGRAVSPWLRAGCRGQAPRRRWRAGSEAARAVDDDRRAGDACPGGTGEASGRFRRHRDLELARVCPP